MYEKNVITPFEVRGVYLFGLMLKTAKIETVFFASILMSKFVWLIYSIN
jgi:hypothetical protein